MPNARLPRLPTSTDTGVIYVTRRGDAYKIGFSRKGLQRRVRDSGGVLVLTIATGQRPASFERAVRQHFEPKRLPPQGTKPGDKREWFALDEDDLSWLKGLKQHVSETQDGVVIVSVIKPQ